MRTRRRIRKLQKETQEVAEDDDVIIVDIKEGEAKKGNSILSKLVC